VTAFEVLCAAGAVWIATTLQSAVGFGMGLVAIPLIVAAGRTLPEAVAIQLGASALQTGLATYRERAQVPWRSGLFIAAVQWLFVPLGVWGMLQLDRTGPEHVNQAVGASVMAALLTRLAVHPAAHHSVPRSWGIAAGATGGLLAGLVGMGGPPLVLYAMAHDWDERRFRAFLWSQFLMAWPPVVIAMVFLQGTRILGFVGLGFALAPVVWLGIRAGGLLSSRWKIATLHRAAHALLVLIAVRGLLGPWLSR